MSLRIQQPSHWLGFLVSKVWGSLCRCKKARNREALQEWPLEDVVLCWGIHASPQAGWPLPKGCLQLGESQLLIDQEGRFWGREGHRIGQQETWTIILFCLQIAGLALQIIENNFYWVKAKRLLSLWCALRALAGRHQMLFKQFMLNCWWNNSLSCLILYSKFYAHHHCAKRAISFCLQFQQEDARSAEKSNP